MFSNVQFCNVGNVASIPQQQPYHFHCRNCVRTACQHTDFSFVKVLGILSTPPTSTQHGHTAKATRQNSAQAETRSYVWTMSIPSSSLQIFVHTRLPIVVQTSDKPMAVGPDYMGVCEKFKFQLPDHFNGSCHKMQTGVIME
jgi:hypothetical protein